MLLEQEPLGEFWKLLEFFKTFLSDSKKQQNHGEHVSFLI